VALRSLDSQKDGLLRAANIDIIDIVVVIRDGPEAQVLEEDRGFIARRGELVADLNIFIVDSITIAKAPADQDAVGKGTCATRWIDANEPCGVSSLIRRLEIRGEACSVSAPRLDERTCYTDSAGSGRYSLEDTSITSAPETEPLLGSLAAMHTIGNISRFILRTAHHQSGRIA